MKDVVLDSADQPVLASTQGWRGLGDYIRQHPSALSKTPDELASEFGVDVNFATSVLAAMRAPVEQASFLEIGAQYVRDTLRSLGQTVRRTFEELTTRPWVCLIGSTSAAFVVVGVLAMFGRTLGIGTNFAFTGAAGALVGAITVLAIMLQGSCYYRHRQMRFALVMTGLVFVAWLGFFGAVVDESGRAALRDGPMPAQSILILASGVLTLMYLFFATGATLIGSYSQFRRQSIQEVETSRQELLDRLFEVERRLGQYDQESVGSRARWVDRIRNSRTFFVNVLLLGVALGMFEVATLGTLGQVSGKPFSLSGSFSVSGLIFYLGNFLLKLLMGAAVGFVAGRPGRSVSALLALAAGIWGAYWFPLGAYGPPMAMSFLDMGSLLQLGTVVFFAGLLTGYSGLVESQNYRQQKLRTDDLATLLAEQIQLQWRLGLGQQAMSVMVVDVAKSTVMKMNADPLKIEWSFREYQNLLAELSSRNGGQVLSTAGDGAVVGFPNPELAVQAAREILTELPRFNNRRNRLEVPFRLRIGIHSGHTEANLADAPYNELIDIAAHIEGAAPIGGIALSGEVAKAVADEVDVAEMAQRIDGQSVFVVLNPTKEH